MQPPRRRHSAPSVSGSTPPRRGLDVPSLRVGSVEEHPGPLHSTPRRELQSSRSGRPGRGGLSGPSGQGCFRSRVSTSPLLPELPPHRSPQAGAKSLTRAVATTLGSELPLPLRDRDGLGRVVALSVPGREVKDSLLDCN